MSSLLVVFDLETTGYTPQYGCVWSIAAIAIREGAILSEFESLVKPQPQFFGPKHQEVIRSVSGLDTAAIYNLLNAPRWDHVLERFNAWITDHVIDCYSVTFTSYNIHFERRFLDAEPFWLSQSVESYTGHTPCWGACLMEGSKKAMGVRQAPKLVDACAHFGIELKGAHQSLADTRAAAQLALKLGLFFNGSEYDDPRLFPNTRHPQADPPMGNVEPNGCQWEGHQSSAPGQLA